MPPSCPQEGTPDLYGIGIRVGLYTQWTSTLLVTIFRQEEEALYRVVNIHLQLAVFACLVLLTVNSSHDGNNTLHPCEVVLSLWLLLGGALSSTTGSEGFLYLKHKKLAGLARLAMYTALASYAVWFWVGGGLDLVQERERFMMKEASGQDKGNGREEECDVGRESIAWFGRAGIDSPAIRNFGKAASIGGLAVCVGLIGYCLYNFWIDWQDSRRGHYEPASSDSDMPTSNKALLAPGRAKGKGQRQRPQTEITLVAVSIGAIILSVTSVEYMIQANSLEGVNGIFAVGQIIPLLVGTMGLLTTVVSIFWESRIFEPRCIRIFGRHYKCT
ncbi:hypothetical protein V8F33_002909 [Rhypophila sp. PSN 637]